MVIREEGSKGAGGRVSAAGVDAGQLWDHGGVTFPEAFGRKGAGCEREGKIEREKDGGCVVFCEVVCVWVRCERWCGSV